jgi:hypothetical protein
VETAGTGAIPAVARWMAMVSGVQPFLAQRLADSDDLVLHIQIDRSRNAVGTPRARLERDRLPLIAMHWLLHPDPRETL